MSCSRIRSVTRWRGSRRPSSPASLKPSRFARLGPTLEAFTAANGIRRGTDPLSSLVEMASRLHATFRYELGSTEVDLPIKSILETGRGVCQDYTHVMIAITRSWGIPSLYVCRGISIWKR